MKVIPFILCLLLIFSSCAKRITSSTLPFKEIIPEKNEYALNLNTGHPPVDVLYLGCGNLAIRYKGELIMIDPFFSVSRFTERKVKSDSLSFERYRAVLKEHGMDLNQVSSVWLGHTHYDHMMDLPMLLHGGLIPSTAVLYGNSFGDDILTNFISAQQYHSLAPDEVYLTDTSYVPGWINASPSIRVMPIKSSHAPHYKVGPIKFHLMKGRLNKKYFKDNFKDASDVTKRKEWRGGDTYSFLIDFVNGSTIEYRLFIQTSASNYPEGKPPTPLPDEKAIDVAFFSTASANFVSPYPVEIVRALNPRKVVFIHWEDFFLKPVDFETTKLVRLTNFRKIDRRLRKNNLKITPEKYIMPRPGTLISVQ